MTDNNALNYRAEGDKERNESEKPSGAAKNLFDRGDIERDGDLESDRERRSDDNITAPDFKDLKERERDTSANTHTEHSNSKRRRKNSSNCDNSLISSYNTNLQERHYSQDSQVSFYNSSFYKYTSIITESISLFSKFKFLN